MSNDFIVKFRPFDKVETNLFRLCRKGEISFDVVAKKRQQRRSSVRLCRSNILDFVERIVRLVAFDNGAST